MGASFPERRHRNRFIETQPCDKQINSVIFVESESLFSGITQKTII